MVFFFSFWLGRNRWKFSLFSPIHPLNLCRHPTFSPVFSCLYLLCKGMEDEGKEFSFKENNTKENYPLEKENYTKKKLRLYAVAKEMKKGKIRSYLWYNIHCMESSEGIWTFFHAFMVFKIKRTTTFSCAWKKKRRKGQLHWEWKRKTINLKQREREKLR